VCDVTDSDIEAKSVSVQIPPISIPWISQIRRLVCDGKKSDIEAKRISMRLPPFSIPRNIRIRRLDFAALPVARNFQTPALQGLDIGYAN